MDMSALNIFWYIGIALCAVYTFLYAKDAVQLWMKKKKSVLVKGKARTCTMEKKWAYTAINVKYEYMAEEMQKGTRSVKGLLPPRISQGMELEIYYEKEGSSFLAEEIKTDIKNIVVLLVMIAVLCTTLIFGM